MATTPMAPAFAGGAPSVRVVTVAELEQPVGFTFAPNGRIVYLERATGAVRSLDPRTGRDRLLHRITGVNSDGERGALGVALHPRWPREPWIYVYVSRAPAGGELRNQLLRLRIRDGRSVSRDVLLNSPIGGRANHNGGRVAFGPDGKLYVVIGDGGEDPGTAQTIVDEPRGKILRLNPDGSVPASNPFASPVWSFGHRNSIGFAFDPVTGRLWESENGPECNDELNRIVAGGNFAWGPSQDCGTPSDGRGHEPRRTRPPAPARVHVRRDRGRDRRRVLRSVRTRRSLRRHDARGLLERHLQGDRRARDARPAHVRALVVRRPAGRSSPDEPRRRGVFHGGRTRRSDLLQRRRGHLPAGPPAEPA